MQEEIRKAVENRLKGCYPAAVVTGSRLAARTVEESFQVLVEGMKLVRRNNGRVLMTVRLDVVFRGVRGDDDLPQRQQRVAENFFALFTPPLVLEQGRVRAEEMEASVIDGTLHLKMDFTAFVTVEEPVTEPMVAGTSIVWKIPVEG